MKIALIYFRIQLRGGLETRLFNYMNYFLERGDDVTIICAKTSDDVVLPPAVKVVKLSTGLVPRQVRMVWFNHRLKKYMTTHDFDFSLSLGRTYHQDAVLAPSNHRGFLKAMNKKGLHPKHFTQNYLDRQIAKRCQKILAASQMMKDELVKYYAAPSENIHILYPPLNVDNFSPPAAAEKTLLRKKYKIAPTTKVFAFVSSSHYRKGLDVLLAAFEMLQDEEVLLLIAGFPEVKTELYNVRFLGFLKEPRELYILADATVLPARYEPYGQVVSESLQCKTPVVVSHKVGAKEILTPHTGIILNTLAPKKWAEQLLALQLTDFIIPDDFILKNELTLRQHIQKMLSICEIKAT